MSFSHGIGKTDSRYKWKINLGNKVLEKVAF